MNAALQEIDVSLDTKKFEIKPSSRGYDPNNLSPGDAADRLNDPDDGIDYDEIIASTQDDFLAGRFGFNTADYATEEEAWEAFDKYMEEIYENWKKKCGITDHPAGVAHDAERGAGRRIFA